MPKDMVISQTVVINRSKMELFNYLKLVRNQDNFSVWNMADPNQVVTEQGVDGTIGFIYSWDSKNKNVGAGSQEIKAFVDGDYIEYELRFVRPMKNVAKSTFQLSDAGNGQTSLTWEFRGPTKFPMSLFKGIFAKMLGKDMAKSLDNLKGVLD